MKNNPYKIISVLISALIIVCIMPFNHIFADELVLDMQPNTCYLAFTSNSGDYYIKSDKAAKVIFINQSANSMTYGGALYVITLDSSTKVYGSYTTSSACALVTPNTNVESRTYDNNTYYRFYFSIAPGNVTNFYTYYERPESGNMSINNASNLAYRYTYGDLAIDPTPPAPPIKAGNLTFNYYTDFASNQQNTIGALQSNRDTITWDYDTTDSNIPGIDLKVDIRAVPSKYYASTEDALESLTWSDLSIDINYSADLGSYQMNWNKRKVSYTWGEVVDKVKLVSNLPDYYNDMVNSWNFKFIKLNDLWYWTGWVYQIRLNTFSGDYTGEWQTIYQISSAPPEGSSETINYYVMNGNGVTEPIYQTIQNINNQNNVTNNTWYVNGSPYSIDNDTSQNWWETLLQFISDLVGSILSFLGSIFDSVITGVLELVNSLGINFLEVFSNLINSIVELFGNIDLTGQNYLIPEEYTENLNTFNIWTTGLFNVFIDSGLGLLVFIPFILLIVRLFI